MVFTLESLYFQIFHAFRLIAGSGSSIDGLTYVAVRQGNIYAHTIFICANVKNRNLYNYLLTKRKYKYISRSLMLG
jgi:hypothetical protein